MARSNTGKRSGSGGLKAERLQVLIKEIRDSGSQSPKQLAEKLGVSERTVYRYLRLLESINLAPISRRRRQKRFTQYYSFRTQEELARAIEQVAKRMSPARARQLYEFALFLEAHPLPIEETLEEIETDEMLWDAQFAATDEEKLKRLITSVEKEAAEGGTFPMFNERGEFVEYE